MTRAIIFISILSISGLYGLAAEKEAWAPDKDTFMLLHFNEGKGDTVHDSSTNAMIGKITGKPAWVEGKFGKGLEFDGKTNWITFDKPILPKGSKTIEAWIQFRGGKHLPEGFNISTLIGDYLVDLVASSKDKEGKLDVWWGTFTAQEGFSLNEWHLLAVQFDAEHSRVQLLIDGKIVGDFPNNASKGFPYDLTTQYIGVSDLLSGSPEKNTWALFCGIIDELRVSQGLKYPNTNYPGTLEQQGLYKAFTSTLEEIRRFVPETGYTLVPDGEFDFLAFRPIFLNPMASWIKQGKGYAILADRKACIGVAPFPEEVGDIVLELACESNDNVNSLKVSAYNPGSQEGNGIISISRQVIKPKTCSVQLIIRTKDLSIDEDGHWKIFLETDKILVIQKINIRPVTWNRAKSAVIFPFDFGPADACEEGYKPVTSETRYTKETGYGWEMLKNELYTNSYWPLKRVLVFSDDGKLGQGDTKNTNKLMRDGIGIGSAGSLVLNYRFKADIPSGFYHVFVMRGTYSRYPPDRSMDIVANGKMAYENLMVPIRDVFEIVSFPVRVEGDTLALDFLGSRGWSVNAVVVIGWPDNKLSSAE